MKFSTLFALVAVAQADPLPEDLTDALEPSMGERDTPARRNLSHSYYGGYGYAYAPATYGYATVGYAPVATYGTYGTNFVSSGYGGTYGGYAFSARPTPYGWGIGY